MELEEFDYDLPPWAIAQTPAESRDAARLLLIDRARRRFTDYVFADLPDLLRPGDCLVVNNSRVIPARVLARDAAGRPVELLFAEPESARRWRALVRPGRRCRVGAELVAGDEPGCRLRVVGIADDGLRIVERADGSIDELLDACGLPPLPTYIVRHAKPDAEDRERYQTVYARPPGSIAAPTAGLHFTAAVLDRLRQRRIEIHELTLHVGPATFRPVKTRRVEDHVLPPERVAIGARVAAAVNAAKAEGRRVVAVGTTTTRALEGATQADGRVRPREGAVDLYITPGHRFQAIDALLTNFHLPRSSLLVLVAAFAEPELIMDAYRHAIAAGYRFYSYGDATLIV
ncbi:MAG: tRNA preQ1(34) S-adenosylmethionine ribosyltransferase-isomerase QueA [Candidatus Rokubacteria bacterium 13_1_40CM_69_27]|nr:MAG: tRNA preQ1(34) S-adenosylmethionine ribosyltransferase-isomerase QueA [Candidatus Rokubacteria bacterium 13_1_40CM_69_27]